jgi:hypothetical protein
MVHQPMTTSSLSQTVDSWTAQAVMASGYLVRLYRALDDDHQTAVAMQAQGSCEERAQRLGFQARIAALQARFVAEQPEEISGEQRAWELLVEAQAGLCAFHGLVDEHEGSGSLRGQRTSTTRALDKSLRGYRTAFPEEMTNLGIRRAVEIAATRCSEAFSLDVVDATDQEKADLREELHANVLDGLLFQTLYNQQ